MSSCLIGRHLISWTAETSAQRILHKPMVSGLSTVLGLGIGELGCTILMDCVFSGARLVSWAPDCRNLPFGLFVGSSLLGRVALPTCSYILINLLGLVCVNRPHGLLYTFGCLFLGGVGFRIYIVVSPEFSQLGLAQATIQTRGRIQKVDPPILDFSTPMV